MYKVFLVDDEPLILSGIKSLLDWEKYACQVTGTAFNGREALKAIHEHVPDIVICDISMPALSGTELLSILQANHPEIAVIMLTNYQEFALVQDSLRYGAVDYLLKTDISEEALAEALKKAKTRHDQYAKIQQISQMDHYLSHDADRLSALRRWHENSTTMPPDAALHSFHMNGLLQSFVIARLHLSCSAFGEEEKYSQFDLDRIRLSCEDILRKMILSVFSSALLWQSGQFEWTVHLPGMPDQYRENISALSHRMKTMVKSALAMDLIVFHSNRHTGKQEYSSACFELLYEEHNWFMSVCGGCNIVSETSLAAYTPQHLMQSEISLLQAIRHRDLPALSGWFDRWSACWTSAYLNRSIALHACDRLREQLIHALERHDGVNTATSFHPTELSSVFGHVEMLTWLKNTSDDLCISLSSEDSRGQERYVRDAQNYILAHVSEKNTLKDVAKAIGLSPNYLSTLFSRYLSVSFVDYVNQQKMQKACEMLKATDTPLYEIANQLHYENPYYFTRLFTQHIGCTPREYRQRYGII